MVASAHVVLNGAVAEQPAPGMKRIRTVVVDDSPTFLQVACTLLELDPLIDLVARASKGGQAIEAVLKLQPELVLMDVHMPYLDGVIFAGSSGRCSNAYPAILCDVFKAYFQTVVWRKMTR
jgi:response regulator RpfG family c-di-GMP phosphodiesterase